MARLKQSSRGVNFSGWAYYEKAGEAHSGKVTSIQAACEQGYTEVLSTMLSTGSQVGETGPCRRQVWSRRVFLDEYTLRSDLGHLLPPPYNESCGDDSGLGEITMSALYL